MVTVHEWGVTVTTELPESLDRAVEAHFVKNEERYDQYLYELMSNCKPIRTTTDG